MTRSIEPAPAKVNLSLRVLGRRPDGYHEIESLVVFADVADDVVLELGGAPHAIVEGPFAGEVTGANIVDRTLASLGEAAPGLRLGTVRITKRIPVSAGLGGGSADAAATLRAVRRANPEHAEAVDWSAIAARLGADVMACLLSRPLVMRGTGTVVEPLATPLALLHGVLVNPQAPVPADKTRAVYGSLAAAPLVAASNGTLGAAPHPNPLPVALRSMGREGDALSSPRWREEGHGEAMRAVRDGVERLAPPRASDPACLLDILAGLGNDLEAPARRLVPAIDTVMAALADTPGCRLVRLSGSGPTCFGLYARGEDADAAAADLAGRHGTWWVQRVRLGQPFNAPG